MKLTVEHFFCQSMSGDWAVLRNGLMGLFAMENGFNNSAEFKTSDSLAEQAFLGQRTSRNHRAYISWLHTKRNHERPSLAFLQSTFCTDMELAAPIYLSSGMRATGRTRQLYIPLGAAQGLRSGIKRACVEEVDVQPVSDTAANDTDSAMSELQRENETLRQENVVLKQRLAALGQEKDVVVRTHPFFDPPPAASTPRAPTIDCDCTSTASSDDTMHESDHDTIMQRNTALKYQFLKHKMEFAKDLVSPEWTLDLPPPAQKLAADVFAVLDRHNKSVIAVDQMGTAHIQEPGPYDALTYVPDHDTLKQENMDLMQRITAIEEEKKTLFLMSPDDESDVQSWLCNEGRFRCPEAPPATSGCPKWFR
jgi:hypothetical protein